jgi:hypothetical protein
VYDPATLLQDPPRLAEQLPFDGMVWAGMDDHHRSSGEGWLGVSVFNCPYELRVEDYSEFIGNMRRLRDLRPDMTEQFLNISPTWTWTTDAETADQEGVQFWFGEKGEGREWPRVLSNLRVACEAAKQAEAGYFRPDFDDRSWPSIRVGEPWDAQGYADLDGSGWYRRPYPCPPLPEGRRVFLLFDAVDESAWLYVDGQLAAWHDENPAAVWDQPFALEVTGHLTGGQEHLLALRVHDTTRSGGIWKPIHLLVEK